MIKNMPFWAKVAWWLSIIILVALVGISVDTLMGVNSGRYDSMALLAFNYLIIPIGGLIVLVWAIVFFLRRRRPS